jgi:hypothetical protein
MELYVEESDILRQPTWNLLHNRGNLVFEREVVLDANLGHIWVSPEESLLSKAPISSPRTGKRTAPTPGMD